MLPRLACGWFILLVVGSASAFGQTVVFDGQSFQSNGAIGFSPSTTIWDDLQTEFNSLASAGTLSEVSISASRFGTPTQAASGYIDIRLFDDAGNRPQGVLIAQIPFDDVFGLDPNDPIGTHTLIRVGGLESMSLSIPQNAKLGVGVFFDDSDWGAVLSDGAIIGSSPGDNWLGNSPTERAEAGVGDFAWRVVVAETAPEVSWLSLAGGEWDDPSAWDTGFTPMPTQDVNALMVTDGLGPLIGPGANTIVKSLDFRSFASDSTFQMQPGVELMATERAVIQGKGQLDVNGGTLRAPDVFVSRFSRFDSGLIEVLGGDFSAELDDFLLSGSADPTIQLNGAHFRVQKIVGGIDIEPAELRIGEEEGHRGTIEATAGASLEAQRAIIGWDVGSAGTLRLAGDGTVATIDADVTLGSSSLTDGELLVEDDAVLNAAQVVIGRFGVGHATVRGGTVNVIENGLNQDSGEIEIGGSPGPGLSDSRLQIEAGGVVNTDRFVGIAGILSGSGASVVVTGAGSELNTGSGVGVGSSRPGSLRVLDGARLTAGGTVGTGLGNNLPAGQVNEVLISGAGTTAEVSGVFVNTRGSLRIDSGATVTTGGITATGGDITIAGQDTLVDASVTTSPLASLSVNNGTLQIESGAEVHSAGLNIGDFNGASSTAVVTGAGTRLTSDGLFFVVSNVSPGTLEIRDGATVDRTGDVIVGAADAADGTLLLTGEGARLEVDGAIYLSGGRLDGQVFDVQGAAVLRIGAGATVATTGVIEPFTNSQIELAGGELVADEITLASGGTFAFSAGRLTTSTFTGDLVNDGLGEVAPSTSPGGTAVTGAYAQGPQAALEIDLIAGGSSPEHDQLTATTAQIDGVLSLVAPDPTMLAVGDAFLVLQATGGLSGTFSDVAGRFFGAGLAAQVDYADPNAVFVEVVRATDLLPGDFNGDGRVDAVDYAVWRDDLGETGANLVSDADNSGAIDTGDYEIWAANYGASFSASGLITVPEPAGLILVSLALGLGAALRTRK